MKVGMHRALCVISLVGALGACAAPAGQTCAPGVGSPSVLFTLYFGQSVPGAGDVTDQAWQSFLDDTITAELPNGYTILDAYGAWMNPMTRNTVKEATKVLIVALPEAPASLAAVNRIRGAYQIRFHQQLVGMTVLQACAAF
jgi:hypothetical protein